MRYTRVQAYRTKNDDVPQTYEEDTARVFMRFIGAAGVASRLVTWFDGYALCLQIASPSGAFEEVHFIPQSEFDRTTLAWMAILVANWQMLALPVDQRQVALELGGTSLDAARQASEVLGVAPWTWAESEATYVTSAVSSISLRALTIEVTFGLDADAIQANYPEIVLDLFNVGFDVNRLREIY